MKKEVKMGTMPEMEVTLILPEGEKVVNKGTVMDDEQTNAKEEQK